MSKPTVNSLSHARIVIAYIQISYSELSVVLFIGLTVLMHRHRRNDAAVTEVRYVECLYPRRVLGKLKRRLKPRKRLGAPLLRRVAGVSAATAKNIVAWREEEGAFTSRAQLKKVKGLGPKAYEQCAGFLRLPEAKNRLDATAVHPESYPAAKALLDACGYTTAEIGSDKLAGLPAAVKAKGTRNLCETLGIGEPTLNDIVAELCKPGRDVRDSLPKPLLRSDVMSLEDLKPGMELTGTVRNVIDFGAFVDLGVHQDGLVHVSQISDKFIKHPSEVLKVGDIVRVKVLNVDTAKKRIALTMKGLH